jgi:hypothetical protein
VYSSRREEARVGIFPSENFYFLMGLRSSEKIVEIKKIIRKVLE